MKVEEIQQFFEVYIRNMEENRSLDESLWETDEKQGWVEAFGVRSKRLREMYEENTQWLSRVFSFLRNEELTPEIAEAFYQGMEEMYLQDCDDYEILLKLVDILLPYYEKLGEANHLVGLYTMAAYEHTEYERRLVPEQFWHDVRWFQGKVREFRSHYEELTDRNRRRIFSNYFNMIVVPLFGEQYLWQRSYELLMEMLEFWDSPLVQQIDADNEDIKGLVEQTRREWLGGISECPPVSKEGRAYFEAEVKKRYREEIAISGSLKDVHRDIYLANLVLRMESGEMTPKEAVEELYQAFQERIAQLPASEKIGHILKVGISEEITEKTDYMVNISANLIDIIRKYGLDVSEYQQVLVQVAKVFFRNWDLIMNSVPPANMDSMLADEFLKLLESLTDQELRIRTFDKVLLRRYAFNLIHFEMVSGLARVMSSYMLREQPELFAGFKGYTTQQVVEHREEILEFVAMSAKYHDIGKVQMGRIIETQNRALSDAEFEEIRVHPILGAQIAERFDFLRPFKDVILGHHKAYDGRGGYPTSFDNTHSDVKPVIDLITLCDCMDAATDHLGRNYAKSKNIDRVIEEFREGKGTKYNPDMVEFIAGHPILREKLIYLVGPGRREVCYRIYDKQAEE